MTRLQEVAIQALSPHRLEPVIGPARAQHFDAVARLAQERLSGRLVLNVSSTATGGGVAEMLQTLLAYARGAGVDAECAVIRGDPEFFRITKRLHNGLYGGPGDGGDLGPPERDHYAKVAADNAAELLTLVRPHDIVLLHDPQTAGLAATVKEMGATVVWRCHVGTDRPNDYVARSWAFLRPFLEEAVDAFVFSRSVFAPEWADAGRSFVIPPSIDPFSAKNEPMTDDDVLRALRFVGLVAGGAERPVAPFTRRDGSPGRIDREVDVMQTGPPPPADVPLVVQVSRWDRMKDMGGVMAGFAEHVDGTRDAHLVLAGPAVRGVADDPEGGEVLDECISLWRRLPRVVRRRVHLVCVPMADADEASAIVNALQRHAAVVVQKSLAEGFGLTVAEAMYKARPVVGSAVGGIAEQIVHEESGLLVADPHDLATFGAHVRRLLDDREEAARLGRAAHVRAVERFLGDRHLEQWAELFERVSP